LDPCAGLLPSRKCTIVVCSVSGCCALPMSSPASVSSLRSLSATIAFVDVVDSVRLIADAEERAVARIRGLLQRAAADVVPACAGEVAERRGDGLVLKFAHTRDAARCAAMLHRLAADAAATAHGEQPLRLRAGMHKTTLLADDEAIYGAGVNLAARIAALGRPGDTLMSAAARDELAEPLDGQLQDMGLCWLKNVDSPVRLFRQREQAPPHADLELAISRRMKLRPTVAVLLLDGPAAQADRSFGLGDVVAHQMTQRLSQSSVLHVISALSAQVLRGRQLTPGQLYPLLRADYLLRGRVEADDGGDDRARHVRLRFELWRQGSDAPVWSEAFAGSAMDLLSVEGEVLGRAVHAVSRRILSVEQRAARAARALPNLASHTLYLTAVDLLHRFSIDDFQRARELLIALSERAPHHAEPLAWLARWHVFRVVQGWSDHRQRDGDEARRYSEDALDRDPRSSLALTMAGSMHAGIKGDAETAQKFYQQALEHNPNDSLAWLMSGVAQGFMNAREPALSASEMALGLAPVDPTRPYYDALSATAALRAGEYERSVALARRAIGANAMHGTAYRSMAIALAMLERHDEAAEAVRRLLGVEPHFTVQTYLARVPHQDAQREHFAQLLGRAGLPAD
jgi:adenylate cyclase